MKSDREDSEKDLADIRNIASKLGGIASIWGCVSCFISSVSLWRILNEHFLVDPSGSQVHRRSRREGVEYAKL